MGKRRNDLPDRASVVHARLGRVLKQKWRLKRLIGMGGMAAVYEATHRNGKRAAIKMLHPNLAIDEAQRTRFVGEGYAANAIDHPGVVRIDDDDVDDDGSVFLVMELLEEESLDVLLERSGGRMPLAEVLSLADQALEVLEAAHEKGTVHRDIKPENLFMTRRTQPQKRSRVSLRAPRPTRRARPMRVRTGSNRRKSSQPSPRRRRQALAVRPWRLRSSCSIAGADCREIG